MQCAWLCGPCQAELARQALDAGLEREAGPDARLAGGTEARALLRMPDQPLERGRQRARVARRYEQTGDLRLDQFRDPRQIGRDRGEALALRLHQHVGQSIAIAILGDSAREREDVRVSICRQHRILRLCAAPLDTLGDAELGGLFPQIPQQWTAADMAE